MSPPGPASRRDFLRIAGTGAASAVLLSACAGPPGPASSTSITTTAAAGPPMIMIIRHAEKPPDSGAPHGVDADGQTDKHSLTTTGWARAGAIVELFASRRGAPPAGLVQPGALFASIGGDSNSIRPQQTLTPLAARLGLSIDTSFSKGQEAQLAAALATRTGPTLVAWQHESIAAIAAHLGTVTPTPPADWPDSRYDMVWVFTRGDAGWRFLQVPQLLLAGDSADPI